MIDQSPSQPSYPRNGGIDLLRLIAAGGIVWFHAHAPGQMLSYSALSLFIVLMVVLPLQRPWKGTTLSFISQRADRLLRPWLIWSGVFAILKICQAVVDNRPISSEFEWSMLVTGTQTHLWFLPFGFVCSIAVFGAIRTIDLTSSMVFPLGILLAMLSLPATSWALDGGLPEPLAQWFYGLPAVFFGVAIYFADHSRQKLLYVSVATLIGYLSAVFISDQFVGLVSFMIGVNLSIVALSVQVTSRAWMQMAAALSMPVYLIHPIFISLLQGLPGVGNSVVTAVASILLSLALGHLIIKLRWSQKLL